MNNQLSGYLECVWARQSRQYHTGSQVQKKLQPIEDEAEFVASGGEDGVYGAP